MYVAYLLNEEQREWLQKIAPPTFPDFIGHHATHKFGVNDDEKLPHRARLTLVELIQDVERGIECFAVLIDNNAFRPDGERYHITWSIDRSKGAKPVNSNDVIAEFYSEISNPNITTSMPAKCELNQLVNAKLLK